MNKKLIAALAAFASALSLVSCSQCYTSPTTAYVQTQPVSIDSANCKLVCPRVSGTSSGVVVLGIPFKSPSEADAVADMYKNARARGCQLEGQSVAFANTSVEKKIRFFIVGVRTTLKVTGDVVNYVGH